MKVLGVVPYIQGNLVVATFNEKDKSMPEANWNDAEARWMLICSYYYFIVD